MKKGQQLQNSRNFLDIIGFHSNCGHFKMSKVEFTATQRDNHTMKRHNFEAIIFEKMLQQVHPLRISGKIIIE